MKIKFLKMQDKMNFNKSFAKKIKLKKIFENENLVLFLKGTIYEEKKAIIQKIIRLYKKKQIGNISNYFNGNYVVFFYDKKNNSYFLSNSQTSHFNLFYKFDKNKIIVTSKINEFKKSKYTINHYRMFEWLLLSGRCLTNQTLIKDVFYLLPGETITKGSDDKFELIKKKYFSYKKKNNVSVENLKNSLKKAINIRTNSIKSNILLGLTGGLDSRILAGLVNNKKTISYTYGHLSNFEKILSNYVSNSLKLKKHINIDVEEKEYFPSKINNKYTNIGNFNTTFQHNYQDSLFKKLSKNNNTNNIMIGCALDQFLGSTFSDKNLIKIKSIDEYYSWFKKKYFLLNVKELKLLFGSNYFTYNRELKKNFKNIIQNFKFQNYVDLNDALHFEIRILRWYNRNLGFVSNDDRNILSPTYDKKFLSLAFQTNYKLRLNDYYRKSLLKEINNSLYNLPTLSSFIPPFIPENLKTIFKKSINYLEEIKLKRNISKKIPSFLYDVNIARMIDDSIYFDNFKSAIFKVMRKNGFKKEIVFLNNMLSKRESKITIYKIKKIIFLLSYFNILVLLNEKN